MTVRDINDGEELFVDYGNFTRMLNHLPLCLANCKFVKN
jgi:hypothetical protein